MTFLLQPPVKYWACPSCGLRDKTQQAGVYTQFHECPALGRVAVPLVEVRHPDDAPDGKHVVVMRDDYVGDSGADPVAAIRTEHGDGSNDCTVYAPTARVIAQGLM
jgi:hypothetical protein